MTLLIFIFAGKGRKVPSAGGPDIRYWETVQVAQRLFVGGVVVPVLPGIVRDGVVGVVLPYIVVQWLYCSGVRMDLTSLLRCSVSGV
jgi:hypothetical protein